MATKPDLTTEDGLRDHLQAGPRSTVSLLSGGTANYVYRVTGLHGMTTIFKHAAPYLHSNKEFKFDPTRMDYEARALELFSPANTSSPWMRELSGSSVHAARLMSYDKDQKLLCIEDGGSKNLKDSYSDPSLDIPSIGAELGDWIAALHMCSRDISLGPSENDGAEAPDNKEMKNNPIGVAIYRHSYANLHHALSGYGHDPQLAHDINERYGSLLATDNECVCHGDFWTGNVLLRPSSDAKRTEPDLTIVDWEMVRRGTSATDVAQFCAEAFLLDRFRGGKGLMSEFLSSYVSARDDVYSDHTIYMAGLMSGAFEKVEDPHTPGKTLLLDAVWTRRLLVQWAVHIAFWPTRVEWTDRAGTQELVDIGVKVLKDVLADDWEALLASPLLKDVRRDFANISCR